MLLNMQTKSVHVMCYNYIMKSEVVILTYSLFYKIEERKNTLHFVTCLLREYTRF